MQSKSYSDSTVREVFPHGCTPLEPFPHENGPSVEQRQRLPSSDLCLPQFTSILSVFFQYVPIDRHRTAISCKISQTFSRDTDSHWAYNLQCAVPLLVLFATNLARKYASVYNFPQTIYNDYQTHAWSTAFDEWNDSHLGPRGTLRVSSWLRGHRRNIC